MKQSVFVLLSVALSGTLYASEGQTALFPFTLDRPFDPEMTEWYDKIYRISHRQLIN
jgi:hypothetical protein